jgi:chitin synthase
MALNLPPLGGGGGAHTQPSLPSLPAHLQSDTHITAHLASRFHVSLPTARLSSHALVSINTYTSSSKGVDGGKEGSAMAGAEDMADRAFIRLGHRSENQAVLFLFVFSPAVSSLLAVLLNPCSGRVSSAQLLTRSALKLGVNPVLESLPSDPIF